MPIIIRNPGLSVEEIVSEPDYGYQTSRKVQVLAITVAYEVMITGMHTHLAPGFGYVERVRIKGTKVSLSSEPIPVVSDGGDQSFPREYSRLVEKRFITDDLGMFGSIPIQAHITVALAPDPSLSADTNVVTISGARYRTTAAVATVANAVFWLKDQLFGGWRVEREG